MMEIDGKELTLEQLKSFRGRLRSDITPNHLDIIVQYDELFHRAIHVEGDLEIDSNLVLHDAEIQVLIVDGDLTVHGRLEDRNDEGIESLILVGGNLRAKDLFTFGTLEVHGNLEGQEHLLLLDNACIAHIEGDLRAKFALDKYHHCRVLGAVDIDTLVQDAERIECSSEPAFTGLDSDAVAGVLQHDLIEGEPDEESEFGFYVDYVDTDAVRSWICEGKPILCNK